MVKEFVHVRDYFAAINEAMVRFSSRDAVKLREVVARTMIEGRTLYTAGNGGSGTVADHFALGMSLNVFRETGRQGRTVCLNSGTMMSAAVNDFGYDRMYAAQLEAVAIPGDLFVALSASGCSINLATAVGRASAMGLKTAAIVGKEGSVSQFADVSVVIDTESAAIAEDMTMMMLHWLYGSFMVKA